MHVGGRKEGGVTKKACKASRMTIDSRIPTMAGRSTSGFHRQKQKQRETGKTTTTHQAKPSQYKMQYCTENGKKTLNNDNGTKDNNKQIRQATNRGKPTNQPTN